MTRYFRNRSCRCARCRVRNFMGAAILVTIGVLVLLEEYRYIPIGEIIPILLIVIGLFLFVAHSVSMEGHVQPWWIRGSTAEPPFHDGSPRQHETDQQVKL